MVRHELIEVSIDGHCGFEAPPQYAQPLTEGRVLVVADKLVELGVEPSRIIATGRGSTEAVTMEVAPDGQANRRVEFFLRFGGVEVPDRKPKDLIIENKIMLLREYVLLPDLIERVREEGEIRQFFMSMPDSIQSMIFGDTSLFVDVDDDDDDSGDIEEG